MKKKKLTPWQVRYCGEVLKDRVTKQFLDYLLSCSREEFDNIMIRFSENREEFDNIMIRFSENEDVNSEARKQMGVFLRNEN